MRRCSELRNFMIFIYGYGFSLILSSRLNEV
jgi:hypothetical protein